MILQNEAKCLKCGDQIFSAHRHDCKTCSCGNLSVDGGMDYIRRAIADKSKVKDLSLELPDYLVVALRHSIDDNKYRCNSLGSVCAIARTLRDEGYIIVEKD